MIKDDDGAAWMYDSTTGRMRIKDDTDIPDGGYHCDSEEDIEVELVRQGYICNTDRRICIVLKMLARKFSDNYQELELIDGILRDLENAEEESEPC